MSEKQKKDQRHNKERPTSPQETEQRQETRSKKPRPVENTNANANANANERTPTDAPALTVGGISVQPQQPAAAPTSGAMGVPATDSSAQQGKVMPEVVSASEFSDDDHEDAQHVPINMADVVDATENSTGTPNTETTEQQQSDHTNVPEEQ